MIRLNTFLVLLCAIVTGVFTSVFSLRATRVLNENFERVRKVEEASLKSLTLAMLEARRFVLARDRRDIEQNSEVAKALLLASKHDHGRELSRLLQGYKERFRCDFIGAIGVHSQLMGVDLPKMPSRIALDAQRDLVTQVNGREALVSCARAQWVSETVGYVVFGYYLNETIAPEVYRSTNVRIAFLDAGRANQGNNAIQLSFGDGDRQSVVIAIKESFLSQVKSTSKSTVLLAGASSLLAIAAMIYFLLNQGFLRGFRELLSAADSASKSLQEGVVEKISIGPRAIREINDLSSALGRYVSGLETFAAKLRAKSRHELLGEVSSQVAHDLNGAISALELAVDPADLARHSQKEAKHFENLFARLRAITAGVKKDLRIAEYAELPQSSGSIFISDEEYSKEHLLPLLEEVVMEKSLEAAHALGSSIELSGWQEAFDIFSKIQRHEFQRALSNILDNAIAASRRHQKVSVELLSGQNGVSICIRDSGIGIPAENLSRIGKRGVSIGKAGGSGFGLWHAMQVVSQWDGSLTLESAPNVGTTVHIGLPAVKPPTWFVSSLELSNIREVWILDDDAYIHDLWRSRFDSSGVTLYCFASAEEFLARFHRRAERPNALVLCDYDLQGTWDGIEVIDELRGAARAILVTHHADKREVRELCEARQIGLVSKALLSSIPILAQKADSQQTQSRRSK